MVHFRDDQVSLGCLEVLWAVYTSTWAVQLILGSATDFHCLREDVLMAYHNRPTFPQLLFSFPGSGNPWFTLSAMRRVSNLTFAPELPRYPIQAMMVSQMDGHDGLSTAVRA